jgi:predicted dehydrogenase
MIIMGKEFNRRQFLGLGSAMLAGAGMLLKCSTDKKIFPLPLFRDKAPDGALIKAGIIGCGDRGTGAAIDLLEAGNNIKITAMADLFNDRLQQSRNRLKEQKNVLVEDKNCFVGFDAYKKLLDMDLDYVIIASPPHFHPMQFAAAVEAGKNIFLEKPVAIDPAGIKKVISASKKAEAIGLSVGVGTIYRHSRDFITTYKKIFEGQIGDIVSANSYHNVGSLWYKMPRKEWSEMEYMIRDWVNWIWLSGDHIVEQSIHNIDVINWFSGKYPHKAVGFGARERRKTGNQYDFFSVDFVYDNGRHFHSMSRQIDGCADNVSEYIQGTEGSSNCQNTIFYPDGSVKWQYDYGYNEKGEKRDHLKISPYVQEHIDLLTAIRENKPYTEAEMSAMSTVVAIMGRISAYTGKEVTFDEVMASDMGYALKEYKFGDVEIDKSVPVPGIG